MLLKFDFLFYLWYNIMGKNKVLQLEKFGNRAKFEKIQKL